jgi:hypothetical protein
LSTGRPRPSEHVASLRADEALIDSTRNAHRANTSALTKIVVGLSQSPLEISSE